MLSTGPAGALRFDVSFGFGFAHPLRIFPAAPRQRTAPVAIHFTSRTSPASARLPPRRRFCSARPAGWWTRRAQTARRSSNRPESAMRRPYFISTATLSETGCVPACCRLLTGVVQATDEEFDQLLIATIAFMIHDHFSSLYVCRAAGSVIRPA
jgi:hypothetical protein